MLKVGVKKTQANFLDRKAVTDAIGKAAAGVLAKQGAYIRTIARRSMKKKKGHAQPGQPPFVHEGQLKDFLYFAFDPATNSVVVGPVKLGKGTAPETLEKGGVVYESGLYRRGKWVPLRVMSTKGRAAAVASGKVIRRKGNVEPRPFMAPALAIAKPKLAAMWKDKVKGK